VKKTVSRMLTGLIVSSMSPRKKVMHDCQKPSVMLIGYVIIPLEQYLDSDIYFFLSKQSWLVCLHICFTFSVLSVMSRDIIRDAVVRAS
jgi:hypothetical protein